MKAELSRWLAAKRFCVRSLTCAPSNLSPIRDSSEYFHLNLRAPARVFLCPTSIACATCKLTSTKIESEHCRKIFTESAQANPRRAKWQIAPTEEALGLFLLSGRWAINPLPAVRMRQNTTTTGGGNA